MSAQSFPLPAGFGGLGRMLAGRNKWIVGGAALALVVALIIATIAIRSQSATSYVTQPVVQQTLLNTVTASGTVNPQNTINVGTQVSGTISQIYVDFNSRVKKGQVLARIDPRTIQAQVDQARANLIQAQAQANAASANATGAASGISVAAANSASASAAIGAAAANVGKARSALQLAQITEGRDAALLAQGYVAQNQVDSDRATVAQDRSDLAAAQAAYAQSKSQAVAQTAQVSQTSSQAAGSMSSSAAAAAAVQAAQATLQQSQYNLDHTVITSPVDGTVIARAVSVGQTVAASLQTPTLFSIAQDLGKMQVDINVGEPDIGNVKAGEPVQFSVLAYPGETFVGKVSQVRINPQTLNNVVTYDVVIDVPNRGNKLLPGMTANATIEVASAPNALVVPLAALQWKPAVAPKSARATNAPARPSTAASGATAASAQSPWGTVTGTSAGASIGAGSTGVLFVQRESSLHPVPVRVGLTTTSQAAVTPLKAGALAAGDAVVIGSSSGTTSTKAVVRSPLTGGGRAPGHGM
ncbi:MAG TPA: efflux RND transporter periplasmic adaptor subunit [Candidatus Dormibacteraeota bacterium]|nr:efflux RND transporter periplasmic adaptor subunit [Candidatus Dormibacteraeota bacterium]